MSEKEERRGEEMHSGEDAIVLWVIVLYGNMVSLVFSSIWFDLLLLLLLFVLLLYLLGFCFDEQRLRAGETVDMPVFFYIDPTMETDLRTQDVTHLTLSYTFFPVEDDEDDPTRDDAIPIGAARFHTTGVALPAGYEMPEIFKQGATKTATNEPITTKNDTTTTTTSATQQTK